MRAAIVEKPGVLVVRDIPPPVMGEYDVLCELLCGATCTGTDQHIIYGRMPWPIHYPVVLGHESVGRAVEVGPRVRYLEEGDLITRVGTPPAEDGSFDIAWGGYTELGIARDHRAMREDGRPEELWRGYRVNRVIPDEIDPAAATMIITWRETLSYLSRMGVGAGSSVLVIGSGGNGLAFAAHARNLGAAEVVMVGSPLREGNARAVGVSKLFDYHAEQIDEEICEAYPDGFDYLIDAVGKTGQIDRVLPVLRPEGTVGLYGIDDFDNAAINPRRARGTFTYFNGGYDEADTHDAVIGFMRDGALDAGVWLDLEHPFELDSIHDAFDALRGRKMVKAVIRLHGGGA